MKSLRRKFFVFAIAFFLSITLSAQNDNSIIGEWQLQKVTFKKTMVANSNNKELVRNVFKAALYDGLTEEQRLTVEDLEWMNAEAELLLDKYYETTINFKANGAFYNTSPLEGKSLSGEYLLDKKKLLLEWETGDKNKFKVLKNTSESLVLKDAELNISYYYLKT